MFISIGFIEIRLSHGYYGHETNTSLLIPFAATGGPANGEPTVKGRERSADSCD